MRPEIRIIFIFFTLIIFSTPKFNAQSIKLNFNPFQISGFMPRLIGIEFEQNFNVKNSLSVVIEYYYMEPSHSGDGDYSGVRAKIAYRRYINNKVSYKGFFVAPSLNYLHTSIPEGGEPEPGASLNTGTRNGYGIGLNIGYQIIFGKSLLLGFSLGPVYYWNHINIEYTFLSIIDQQYWDNYFELDFEISVGWIIK